MKINIENWSIVIVGAWNPAILNPNWLTKVLSLETPITVEFPIGNLSLPIRYRFNNILLVARQDALVLAPTLDDSETLSRMEQYATIIVETLVHTPIAAIGFNFDFIENDSAVEIQKIFNFEDRSLIAESGFVVQTASVRRTIHNAEKNIQLNLTISRNESSQITLNFNFNKDVVNAEAACNYLKEKVVLSRNYAVEFLKNAYGLEFEEGDGL